MITNDDMMIMFDKMVARSVVENDCWVWQGSKTIHGYGQVYARKNVSMHVHRLSYFVSDMTKGEGVVRHLCSNPPCWNPQHLILGTQSQNVRDAINAGRWQYRGILLDHEGRALVRELWLTRYFSQYEIASIMGISQVSVSNIVRDICVQRLSRKEQRANITRAPELVQRFKYPNEKGQLKIRVRNDFG